jgi:hypothetical protein
MDEGGKGVNARVSEGGIRKGGRFTRGGFFDGGWGDGVGGLWDLQGAESFWQWHF